MNVSDTLAFTVPGRAVAQGSKNAFVVKNRAVMAESNKKLKPWRDLVSLRCQEAMYREGYTLVGGAPMGLVVVFRFPRPKTHYRVGGELRQTAPTLMPIRPDLDKLVRAIGDALTGTIVKDDSQFAIITAMKSYVSGPYGTEGCVDIKVMKL